MLHEKEFRMTQLTGVQAEFTNGKDRHISLLVHNLQSFTGGSDYRFD
jgi:hypothetical protein